MSERPEKKKRIRGFAGVINTQLAPLNTNEYFQKTFQDEKFKLLLNATDGKFAALVTVDKGKIDVDSVDNTPRESIKKKVLGWNGKLETTMPIFLDVAMGKISTMGMLKKVIARKIRLKGIRTLLKLLKMFNILSYEEKKENPE